MNRAFQLTSFTSYFLDAIDRYSIHSPFVFDFYNAVIRGDRLKEDFKAIESIRKELKQSKRVIEIDDKGTGVLTHRQVAEIAGSSLTKPAYSRILYRLCKFVNAGTTLELGTSLGINSSYLAKGSKKLVTIEGSEVIAEIAKETFRKLDQTNVQIINADISHSLKSTLDQIDNLDLVFVDANHSYDATLHYFTLLLKKSHNDTVMVFDDIYWSKDMNRAWQQIMQEKQVSLSIDLFQFGVIFINPEFQKQDFKLWFRPW